MFITFSRGSAALTLLILSYFLVSCGSAPIKLADPNTRTTPFPDGLYSAKIMIVGDSISAGPGCYKKALKNHLINNGINRFEFVGSYSDDCGGDVYHSAVSCSTSANYLDWEFRLPNCHGDKAFAGVTKLMREHTPDMVMMQLGVNDVWGGSTSVEYVLKNYNKLVEKMRAENPYVVIVVAQIHKIITDDCVNFGGYRNAEMLVQAVPGWAKSVSTPQSPVYVADLWSNSDPHDADDCVHPNNTGAEKMALNWYNAIEGILRTVPAAPQPK